MMRAENGLKNEKSGGDRDIPLLPTRRAYDFTVTRRINGREEKRSPRGGGGRGRGRGEESSSRGHKVEEPGGRVSSGRPLDETAYPLPFPWLYAVIPYRHGPRGYRPSPPSSPCPPWPPPWPPVTDSIGARAATCPFPRLNNAARPTWRNIAHEETTTATAASSGGVLQRRWCYNFARARARIRAVSLLLFPSFL